MDEKKIISEVGKWINTNENRFEPVNHMEIIKKTFRLTKQQMKIDGKELICPDCKEDGMNLICCNCKSEFPVTEIQKLKEQKKNG